MAGGGTGLRRWDDDPERDPEYEDALARYVTANQPSNEEKIRQVNEALAAATPSNEQRIREVNAAAYGPPAPMAQPVAALNAMASGASMPSRAEQIAAATGDPERLDRLLTPGFQPVRSTPAGEATFRDLQAAGRASIPPSNMFTAGLQGLKQVAPYVGNAIMRMGGMDTGPILPDSTPAASPALPAVPPRPAMVDGALPPAPAAAPATRTVQVGRPAQVRVANAVMAQSNAPPVPSGDIPPGAPTGPASSVPPAALARAREVLGPTPQRPDPLQLALAAARNNRLIAGSAQAGATAIGHGADPGLAELEANADRPLQELGLVQQQADKAKAEALANGPLSPAEQSVYGKLLAQAGVNIDPAMLAKLPAGKIRSLIPDLDKMAAIEATRGEKGAALEREKARDAETVRHNKVQEGIERTKAAKEAGGGGKPIPETEALKIVNQQKALAAIDKLQALHSKTGAVESLSPVGDTAGNEYQDAVKALSSAVAAGAMPAGRETPGMMEEIARSLPTKFTSHERARAAFDQLRRQIQENAAGQIDVAKAGGYSPAQVQALTQLGKTAPVAAGGGPTPDDLERLWSGGR